jgi:glycosyltransferase involved in cell wall biosynthesis
VKEMIKSNNPPPRVSIGLAVYNGEKFLEQALRSILGQTYRDFELIISDNASTDRTQEICSSFGMSDRRIKYSRNEKNIGGANNENRTFLLSSGEYFRWAAYDDICASDLVERCVDVLDRNDSVVLCFSTVIDIDGEGNHLKVHDRNYATSEFPNERFLKMIDLNHHCEESYGLIRSKVLRRTRLQQNYTDSDRTLLSELSLYGKFYQIREPLFFRRIHPTKSTVVFSNWRERMLWFDAGLKDRIVLPHWMQFIDYLKTIGRAPITMLEKIRCYGHMMRWLFAYGHYRWMLKDIYLAVLKTMQKTLGIMKGKSPIISLQSQPTNNYPTPQEKPNASSSYRK